MKKSKFLASLLAVIMLMTTLATTMVSAYETQPTAQIKIQNDFKTSGLTIQGRTYSIYKVMDATVIKGTGELPDTMEYHVSDDFIKFFTDLGFDPGTAGSSGEHTAFDNDVIQYIIGTSNGDYVDGTGTIKVYENIQALIADLRKYAINENIAPATEASVRTVTGNSLETITSEELNPGYYMVVDNVDTVGTNQTATASTLTSLPSRAVNGTLTGDVTINVKGSAPNVDKEIYHNDTKDWDTVADYQIGDVVEFRVTAEVPDNMTGYTKYIYNITDTMTKGLSFNDDIDIHLKPDFSDEPASGNLHETNLGSEVNEDYTFQLVFDMLAIKAKFPLLEEFYISYSATVTEEAIVHPNGGEENTLTLEYSNNPYDESSTAEVTDTVYGYTFDLDVLKTSGDGVSPLKGAKFALYEGVTDAQNDKYTETQIYLNFVKQAEDGTDIYAVSTDDATEDNGVITTTESGKFTIIGLDDAKNYVLKELQAPEGYNKADPVSFTITATYDLEKGYTPIVSSTIGDDISLTVINTSAALLPSTGGIGTTIFMVIGGSLMLGAVVFLVVRRKKTTK